MIFVQFAVLGIAIGAVYALTASGIVLVYRGSGVVNFAHGGIAAIGTYTYYSVVETHGGPWPLGLVLGVAMSSFLGAAVHLVVMKPMRKSSPLVRIIATLGVLVAIQAGLLIWAPPGELNVESFYPEGVLRFGRVAVGLDRLVVSAIAVALAVSLTVLWRVSRFGLATSAVAENRRAAAALGVSPDVVAAVNWAVGCGLGGLAGILLAPILGLQITTITSLLFPALAAALIGRMSSFMLTLVGGLAIGSMQSILANEFPSASWWRVAVPFAVILIMMAVRGRGIPVRGEHGDRLPNLGSGRVRWPAVVFGVAAALFFAWGPLGVGYTDATTTTLTTAMLLLSLVVVTGYAGQVSLCQHALAGLGAFVVGRTVAAWGLPLELAIVLGIVAAFAVGLLIGLPALRTRGVSLAVLTLGFAVVLQEMVFSNFDLTTLNGDDVGGAVLFGWDLNAIEHPERFAAFALLLFVVAALFVANLRRSVIGRRLIAIRESERAAAALGINVYAAKLFAFSVAASIASLGGIMSALRTPIFTYDTNYESMRSINLLVYSVIGGVGSIAGTGLASFMAVPGAVMYEALGFLREHSDQMLAFIGGLGVIFMLYDAPEGLAMLAIKRGQQISKLFRRGRPATVRMSGDVKAALAAAESSHVELTRVSPKTLELHGVTVRFGGVTATEEVSLRVAPGEVHGIIGPNGAGKTTLIDAITGYVVPAAGRITLDGVELNELSTSRRSGLGVGRSFQNLELFEDLTVLENIQTACDPKGLARYATDLLRPARSRLNDAALEAVRQFRLQGDLHRKVRELPYGRRRLCAIARAVAARPSVLLLDEPAAGLTDAESREVGELIRELAEVQGMAVLLIEHNVDLVVRISDRVTAIDFGVVIATGDPAEVRSSAAVMRAYIGELSPAEAEAEAADVELVTDRSN